MAVAEKATATKAAKTLALIGEINIPILEFDDLVREAVDHSNRLHDQMQKFLPAKERESPITITDLDPAARDRLCFKYLKEASNYGELVERLDGRTGREAAERLLSEKLVDQIAKHYGFRINPYPMLHMDQRI